MNCCMRDWGMVALAGALGACLMCGVARTEGNESEDSVFLIASEPYEDQTKFGTPWETPVVLYRITEGRPSHVRTITTRQQGALFSRVYHDRNYVVIGSEGAVPGSTLVDVIDMGSVSAEKSYDVDACKNCTFFAVHLLGTAEGPIVLIQHIADSNRRKRSFSRGGLPMRNWRDNQYRTVSFLRVGPGQTLGEMETTWWQGIDLDRRLVLNDLNGSLLGKAYSYGASGAFVQGEDFLYPIRDRNGEAVIVREGREVSLGWKLPDGVRWFDEVGAGALEMEEEDPGFPRPVTVQVANTDTLRALSGKGTNGPSGPGREFHVFDKQAERWARINFPGELFQIRTYGPWIAVEECFLPGYRYGSAWEKSVEYQRLDAQRAPFSFYASEPDYFPSTAERLEMFTPMGRLHLYHAIRQFHVVSELSEVNSEILYVDDSDQVYYRVNDEIRRAQAGINGFENQVTLAKSPVIFAVHHLFIGKM